MPFPFNPFGAAGRVGEMSGPGSSTDNAVARWDGTTGVLLQDSAATIDDNGTINIPAGEEYQINGVALAHSDLGGVGEDDHHDAFEGLEDNAGATISPAADNRIQFTDDSKINVDAGGAGIIALSIDETQFSGIPEAALAAAVQAQLVTNGDSHDHSGGDGGTIAHANLSGLANDDHTQYILASGARSFAGNVDMGTNNITNVGTVDGVDVSAHATRHQSGGADSIKLDDLAAPDDNTDLNVSITAHGLAPKAPNDATQYLDGTGSWSVPDSGGSGVDVRQSILSAYKDASGYCDIIGGTGTATATIEADSVDLVMAWAGGYDTDGLPVDYTYAEDTDKTVAMTAGAINYIFADYNAGSPTYSKTLYPPQYLEAEPGDGIAFGAVLADFEGTDGDTSFTGAYGEDGWTFAGNAHIEQDAAKFGSTSVRFDGASDGLYLPELTSTVIGGFSTWTIDFFFRMDDNTPAAAEQLFSSTTTGGWPLSLRVNTNGKLALFVSSTGSSWDVVNGTESSSAVAAADTFYHCAVVFDGDAYKVYLDGVEEISVASSAVIDLGGDVFILGSTGPTYANCLAGYIDAFRFSPYVRWTGAFTPPASQPTVDDLYYFNIPEMTMYVGQPGAFVADTILFLGETDVGTDGDIDSVASYALRGRYDSGWFASLGNDQLTNKNHNLGLVPGQLDCWIKCVSSDVGYSVGDIVKISDLQNGTSDDRGMAVYNASRNSAKIVNGVSLALVNPTTYNGGLWTPGDWNAKIIASRGW